MDLPNGTLIDDKYEIVGTIGAGGMGCVYRAKQHPFDREVAIKMLSAQVPMDDPEAVARFEREALANSALKHKYIVMFYGYGIWRGAPYMVMECVNGTNLQQLLSNNVPLDSIAVIRIGSQLCDALKCAHAYGIVHRDLKPNNIMIVGDQSQGFAIKVIDFGLARVLPSFGLEVQKLTQAGCAIGSVLYMSPEQCVGEETDPRSDLYAVGCIMHHCLTGRPPFDGDHSVVVMQKHLADPLPRLQDCNPKLASSPIVDSLQSFLDKATAKNRDARYQSADEMLTDLKIISGGEHTPIISLPGTIFGAPLNVYNPGTKKNRTKQIMLLAALSVVACGSIAYLSAHISEKGSAAAPEDTANLTRLCNEASKLIAQGKADESLAQFQRVITADRRVHLLGLSERLHAYNTASTLLLIKKEFAKAAELALEGIDANKEQFATPSGNNDFRAMVDTYLTASDAIGKSKEATEYLRKNVQAVGNSDSGNACEWQLRLIARLREEEIPLAEYVEMVKEIEDRTKDADVLMHVKIVGGSALVESGRVAEGKEKLIEANEFLEKHRNEIKQPLVYLWAARGYMALHDTKNARRCIDDFLEKLPNGATLALPVQAYCDAIDARYEDCVKKCSRISDESATYNAGMENEVIRDMTKMQTILQQNGQPEFAERLQDYITRIQADVNNRYPQWKS